MTLTGGISVIGAGTMGNGIAHVFAQAGFNVTIVDVSLAQLDRAVATITKNLDRQVAKGTITEEQKKLMMILDLCIVLNCRNHVFDHPCPKG